MRLRRANRGPAVRARRCARARRSPRAATAATTMTTAPAATTTAPPRPRPRAKTAATRAADVRDRHRELHHRPDAPSRSPATRSRSARACRSRASTPRSPRSCSGEQAYIDYVNAEKGGVTVGGQEVQDRARREGRRVRAPSRPSRTCSRSSTTTRCSALFNVVGTKNNLAIRDLVNESCVPEPLRGDRFARVGQPDVPVADRHVRSFRTRSRCRRSSTTSARTSPTRRSRSCGPTTTSARRTPRRCSQLIEGTELTIVGRGDLRPRDR